jgi:hypothetical protein
MLSANIDVYKTHDSIKHFLILTILIYLRIFNFNKLKVLIFNTH